MGYRTWRQELIHFIHKFLLPAVCCFVALGIATHIANRSSPDASTAVCLRIAHKIKTPEGVSNFVRGTGLETYCFSTHSGYFCSAFASKTISERLQVRPPVASATVAVYRAQWSQVTKFTLFTKYFRPRLVCFCIRNSKNMTPPRTKVRKQSLLLPRL